MVRDRFADAGLDTPELDARLLAERAFGLDGAQLAAREHEPVPGEHLAHLDGFAQARLDGAPVARILGTKEFFGLEFALNAATLVPRPDTELVVELGLEFLGDHKQARILDLGTGSGCIVTALLANMPGATGVAVDLSEEALGQAADNAVRHCVSERIDFRVGSWFDPVDDGETFDLIVSNPPYIESAVISGLAREVREHDPMMALDGGPDGLAPYRIIAQAAQNYIAAQGAVVVEVGAGQADMVNDMFIVAGFEKSSVHNDLAGVARAVLAIS